MVAWKSQLNRSGTWLLAAVGALALLVWPWGNYPINDDWQYARIVKHLVETGQFLVDVDVAPSLVGQVWLAVPFVKLFGFSHTLLRILTALVAVLLLWIVDRIIARAGSGRAVRVLVALLLLGNPIFAHLTFSFMTEVYGYALALAGALLWLEDRARRGDEPGAALIGWPAGLMAATLVGGSFWIRQFCVAIFPALVGSALLGVGMRRDRRALVRSLPVLSVSIAWFVVVVLLYFSWARSSGNFRSAFQMRVDVLTHLDPRLILLSAFELATYLTAFLFPFLLLERWRNTRWSAFAGLVALGAVAIYFARGVQPAYAAFHHHVSFPFSANLVNDTNVGPITLTTPYWVPSAPRPRWPEGVWSAIEWLLCGGALAWWRLATRDAVEERPTPLAAEIRSFGVLFAVISFVLYVQAFQREVLDRYFLPCILGALIALGARAARSPEIKRPWLPLLAALPLLWFTVAGVHDYFRWNDARWEAVRLVEAQGGNPQLVDGGYEVNGWLNYDASVERSKPQGCLGSCGCRQGAFYCTDDSYIISTELPRGRAVLATLPVAWWLAEGPPIILSARR